MTTFPFPEVHGHRGCRGLRPENTLPSFLHALRLGVDVIEMDVVISADNQVVVSHEPWMSATICRTPTGNFIPAELQTEHNLYGLPYAHIHQYDCGLTQHPFYPEQKPEPAYKPLLREAIVALDVLAQELGRAPVSLSIEVKSSPNGDGLFHPPPVQFVALVLAELQALGVLSRSTLLSFDKRVLQAIRQMMPEVSTCLLVEDTQTFESHLMELGFLPTVYGPDFRLLTAGLVAALRELDIQLVPWTVNELPDLKRVLELCPTGITTDYPDRLLALRL